MRAKKILVVDDDPDIVAYFSSFLEDNGYVVDSAHDANSAKRVIETFLPDIVLIDVLMPGRSGLDLLVTLRSDPRWSNLAVVVITGHDKILQDDCQSYFGLHDGVRGPDAVLGKPVDRESLLEVLQQLPGPSASAPDD
jgi:CheY-like chemotaxis protein